VDPGTFTYTASAEDRDRFRHSASHNTVTVDGQSASVPAGPFSWAIRTDARCDAWFAGANVDWFVGSHPGFQRLADPVTHRRSVLFVHDGYFVVVDSILAEGEHESVAHWHAAMWSTVAQLSPTSAVVAAPCTDGTRALFLGAAGDVDSMEWDEDWVSPSYGRRTLAPRARLVSRGRGQRDLITLLAPVDASDLVRMHELPAVEGRALSVSRQGTYDVVLLGTSGRVNAAGVTGEADAVLVRRASAGGGIESVAQLGATARVSREGRELRANGGGEWSSTDLAES
jgi:hypothetical protein